MLDRRKGQQPTKLGTGAAAAIIAALALCQHLHFVCTEEPPEQQQRNKTAQNRIPPSIYTWIEENAHICTIVPANGESLINFLSEDEGAKCALCPELSPHELPGMACAIEVTPNEIDVGIGCHPVPELCLLELKTLYAEFFTSGLPGGMPPGAPGNKNEHRSQSSLEEDIFKATGNLFTSVTDESNSVMEVTSEKTDEHLDEEEEEEEEDEQGKRRDKLGEDTTPTETTNATTMTTSTTATSATSSTTIQPSTTTTSVRANIFARPSPQGFPINLTMEEMHLLSRTSKPQKGWSSLIPPQVKVGEKTGDEGEEMPMEVKSPANTEPMLMKKRAKGRTGNEVEEEQEVEEELAKESGGPCKDRHELCCFWAMSGECDSNPFWMRTKCPMTCGTCGCKVRNADKCRSIGVKCVSTTTTTTTTTTTPSTTAMTTPSSTTTTPTPPPATSPPSSRRRPRPTPPQMPGHRPQRPRQRSRTSTTTTATTTSSSSSMETTTAQNLSSTLPTTTSPSTTITKEICFNFHKLCDFWAKMGECLNNPFWMRPHCQVSCNSCGETLGDISTPPARSGCNNEHILCPFWAFIGECARNPRWMSLNCRASCELC